MVANVLEIWDRETARSRATLQRRIGLILAESRRFAGTSQPDAEALSQASLGP
jgi:septum formation topological specificity factor MinE